MLSIFKPAPHKARLPAAEIDPTYRRLRWQIFIGIFFGYAAYYLVRKNFALAMPYLVEQGFSRGDLGFALSGISIAWIFEIHHGFGIGSLESARFPARRFDSWPRWVMLFMGFVPWATSSIAVMFVLLFLCGWFEDGVAAVWSYYGALVVAERTWRHCVSVELCAQRRWWYSAAAVPAGDGVVQ